MKRKFITFTAALIVAACAVFSGCSCTGNTTLSFKSTFSGGEAPTASYTETLEYRIDYSEDYLERFKKDAGLSSAITFEYSNGLYRSEFKTAPLSELADIESDIKTDGRVNAVYKITTEFSVDFKILTINGETSDFTHTETISTVAYIASAGVSFAPLYAKEQAEYCIVSVADKKAEVAITESVNETLYNVDDYTKTLTYAEYRINETADSENAVKGTKSDKVKYDFLTAIDNAEFFFALRGISLEEKGTTNIPVVSLAYTDPTSLQITNTGVAEERMTLNYVKNGNPTVISDTAIKYNTYEYRINKTNAAGWSQHVNIQTEKAGDLPNLALPLKFAKPLASLNGVNSVNMGSLVFTLTDVIVNDL